MNAAEKATSLEIAHRIAAVVTLVRQEFPGIKANLNPWNSDPDTLEWMDPDSIDIGFNLPPGQALMQLRLHNQRFIGIEVLCFGPFGDERWKFSTIGDWQFLGPSPPAQEFEGKLKRICQDIFALFNYESEASA